MQKEQNLLIDELLTLTDNAIASAKKFKCLPENDLNFKKEKNDWSILECLEHLNLYGMFYLPEIEKQLSKSNNRNDNTTFKSGIIGNYFANLMKVDKGIKKMKTPKDKNPANSNLSVTTIDRFLEQSEKLKSLLLQSKKANLTKVKTAISLTKLIRLRLGDTLRFIVYHNERHIIQAQRTIKKGQ
jgi:hypothetical protein